MTALSAVPNIFSPAEQKVITPATIFIAPPSARRAAPAIANVPISAASPVMNVLFSFTHDSMCFAASFRIFKTEVISEASSSPSAIPKDSTAERNFLNELLSPLSISFLVRAAASVLWSSARMNSSILLVSAVIESPPVIPRKSKTSLAKESRSALPMLLITPDNSTIMSRILRKLPVLSVVCIP